MHMSILSTILMQDGKNIGNLKIWEDYKSIRKRKVVVTFILKTPVSKNRLNHYKFNELHELK